MLESRTQSQAFGQAATLRVARRPFARGPMAKANVVID